MAKNPQTVNEFLDKIYNAAIEPARAEVQELAEFAKKIDGLAELQAWDAAYYTEKLKQEKFEFDEEKLRPYFKAENVIDGVFTIAKKLYDLDFKQVDNIPLYHEDVKTFEVSNGNGFVGLLYVDLHPRATKRGGAWMTTFRSQGLQQGQVKRPHVAIVANLTASTDTSPALLRLNEVRTIFHEFGHALHALLSDCKYTALASPNVYWDFVELPSQIMENWLTEKEALNLFAKHYKTGELIPAELVEKVKKLQKFHAGMNNIRQISLGLLDMAWHAQDPSSVEDVAKFEAEVTEKTRLYPPNDKKNTSTAFAHIFAGGYSSGYYSYKWAEVLEADAFEKFLEDGIFNAETAASFRDNILARGNTKHPMELYEAFRGRKPDEEALLRRDGLLK
jgi:Zn-dependent oligopeptidase